MRLSFTIVILLYLTSQQAFPQFRKSDYKIVSADILNGTILKHKEGVSHLLTSRPTGFRINLERQTSGKEAWEQRYNYPDLGLTLTYLDYQNPALGKTIGITPYFGFYLTKNKSAKSQFRYKLGLGFGYTSKIYDSVENNKNNVISTRITGEVLLEFDHFYKLSSRFETAVSVALTHFSNGALKKPNSGINVLSANLGLRYRLTNHTKEYTKVEDVSLVKNPLGYVFTVKAGMHEAIKIASGTYPFLVLSGMLDKQLNHKSRVVLGLEWFYSESLKREIRYDNLIEGKKPNSDRIGLFLSHELMVNEFSIIAQAGYYIYDPYNAFDAIYLRVNLRRYVGEHFFGGFGVKSHAAKAEAAEFILGYRI